MSVCRSNWGRSRPIEMTSATHVSIRVRPKTEERCRYSGVVVPTNSCGKSVRPHSTSAESVLTPQPSKIVLHTGSSSTTGLLQAAAWAMFRVATHRRTMFNGHILGEGAQYIVLELGQMPEDSVEVGAPSAGQACPGG